MFIIYITKFTFYQLSKYFKFLYNKYMKKTSYLLIRNPKNTEINLKIAIK
jgi:hypothetical protein